MLSTIRFILFSTFFWLVFYLVYLQPESQKLDDLQGRSNNLQYEINKIEGNLLHLQAEREVLNSNDRFYIKRLSREKLRLQPENN